MSTYLRLAIGALLAILPAGAARASPGDLDPTFGAGGYVLTNIGVGRSGQAYAVAIQGDGKAVVSGSGFNGRDDDLALARFNVDGSLDTTFGNGAGVVTTYTGPEYEYAAAVAIQSDGRIVVTGYSDAGLLVARYQSDGQLDTTFGGVGVVSTPLPSFGFAHSLAIQDDGKVVVGGVLFRSGNNQDFLIIRYDADGSLDTTFGNGGIATTDIGSYDEVRAVVIQSDGKIVATGSTNDVDYTVVATARYNADGSLDPTFSGDGLDLSGIGPGGSSGHSVALQPDGKIVVGVYSHESGTFAAIRYGSNGNPDETFGDHGTVVTDLELSDAHAYAIALQQDGRIVLAGQSRVGISDDDDIAMARYTTDGDLDVSFGMNGIVTTDLGGSNEFARAVAVQSDGKLVVAAYHIAYDDIGGNYEDITVLRYDTNGTLDTDFDDDGITTTVAGKSEDYVSDMTLQNDGKIVAVGSSQGGPDGLHHCFIVRHTASGVLDTSFGTNGVASCDSADSESAVAVVTQANDQILVVGHRLTLRRLNADGSADLSFGDNGVVSFGEGDARAIAAVLQTDGKLVVTGSYIEAGDSNVAVIRFLPDGTLDPSFHGDGIVTTDLGGDEDYGADVAIQRDGKVVVNAVAPTSNGYPSDDFRIVRYDAVGNLDPSFGEGGIVRTDFFDTVDVATTIAIQPDGKIVAGGDISLDDEGSSTIDDCYFSCPAFARYEADGSLDQEFGEGGRVVAYGHSISIRSVVTQGDGKIVAAGSTSDDYEYPPIVVGRYNADGSLDTEFGGDTEGFVYTSLGDVSRTWVASMALQADGRLTLAGQYSGPRGVDVALVLYLMTNCGDNQVEFGEGCDDGNIQEGDGCTAGCTIEDGWKCDSGPATCEPIHGDGVVVGDEECDDGNADFGDGCSAEGSVEVGYKCIGQPSECTWSCGDGVTDESEECDDGNETNGDGCSDLCESQQLCGDANDDGRHSASDAVLILKAAIGIDVICPTWICDVDGQSGPKATDALTVLQLSVGLPATVQCGDITALVLRLMDPMVVAGLNATFDLSDVAGTLVGTGSSVECENLIQGVTAVFNRPDVATLRIGYVSLEGIQGPVSLARCEFTAIRDVRSSDFEVTVEDAVDLSDNPIVPPPRIDAIPY